ncbi:MAG TPA: hypothetical protein VFD25_03860 [Clostridia bacterium]|nr:hypothetical protein [Clostridia bacterium]
MLEYLKFSYSNSKAKIGFSAYVENGELKLQKGFSDSEEINSCPVSDKECKTWLENLQILHPEKWQAKYMPEIESDNGKWSIDYKRDGKRCRHIKGEGAYPDNWSEFLTLMYKLSPLTEPDRIEKAEFIFRGKTDIRNVTDKKYLQDTVFADCIEKLVLDRQKDTITYSRKIEKKLIFNKRCYIKDSVSSLLDECKASLIKPITSGTYETKDGVVLTIKLRFLKNAPLTRKFIYNGRDLPEKIKDIIELIFSSISLFEEKGELYSQSFRSNRTKEIEDIKNINEKFYCPFCSREIEKEECYEIYESAKNINIDFDMTDWVKEELLRKKEICINCKNRPGL